MDDIERERRIAIVVDECGGLQPMHRAFYELALRYSVSSALAAFTRYDSSVAASDALGAVSNLHEALTHAAALARFFDPSRKQKLHVARSEALRTQFAVESDSAILDGQMRDALEHFDERIDRYLIEHEVGFFMPEPMIGDSEGITSDPYGCVFKLVDPKRQVFVLLKQEMPFAGLRAEVSRIGLLLGVEQ